MAARESPGLIGDVSSLVGNGLRAIRTRLELATIELKEEKAWVVRFIVVAVGAVYIMSFGTLLAILAISLAIPEDARPAFLGSFGGVLIAVGVAGMAWIVVSAKKRSSPFQDTIATLKRDERSLTGAGGE
jgi:uncharacterized membrane protein YqjE